jgi:hypothetical protein
MIGKDPVNVVFDCTVFAQALINPNGRAGVFSCMRSVVACCCL